MKVTVSITPQSLCVAASVGVFAALIVRAVVSRRSAPRAPQSSVERIFSPLPAVLAACAAAEGGSQETQRRREWLREAPTALPKVPLLLWVAYRQWVDSVISGQKGKSESFHAFVYGWTLGLHVSPNNLKDHWSGAEAADLLATLAAADMLVGDGAAPLDALKAWLERALAVFDGRFLLARDRQYVGLTHAEEANWTGSYDFIQLADPQLGMLHWDAQWTEELTMLRVAIQHVNRLRPKFLLISGDLINAFPSSDPDNTAAAREVVSFKDALHELDTDIPLVLQPGNHDIGQHATIETIRTYAERFGDDYFSFWAGGVLYVSLNSQFYRSDKGIEHLRKAQDEWAIETFRTAKTLGAKHVVGLSHVPPFVGDESEVFGWSNWELAARETLLDAAADAGCKLWLAGHYHGNAVGRSSTGIEVVTTSSCGGVINWTLPAAEIAPQPFPDFAKVVGSPPVVADARHSGLRIVRVTEDGFRHRWFELAHVPNTTDEAFTAPSGWKTVKSRYQSLESVLGLKRSKTGRRSTLLDALKKAEEACSSEAAEQEEQSSLHERLERRGSLSRQNTGTLSRQNTASLPEGPTG